MATRYLLLWLQAPLQSWGHDSKFGRRDTLNFPTKSGVMGLVCCALGAKGEQREFLAEFAPLKQTVLSFVRKNHKNEKTDREPLLRDFHMVGSGYKNGALSTRHPNYDPWESLLIPMTWNPKTKKTGIANNADGSRGGVKMTYRYYLQDAHFAVILEVPDDKKANLIATALQSPVWDLFLGRKSCVPTDLVFRGIFDIEDDAIVEAENIAAEKNLLPDLKVLDGEHVGEVLTLNDVPVCFGERKVYRDRRVTLI